MEAIFLNDNRVDNLFVGGPSVIQKTIEEYIALLYQEVSVWDT